MELQLCFHILNIPETREENQIREAYLTLLKTTHPEDDPEGFKRLRTAYETALNWARKKEEPEEALTPVQLWLSEVDRLYQDILNRPDPELWKELLSHPLCQDLDTSLSTREAFLGYLMDHIYLPHPIWVLIDQTFLITEDRGSLAELFPQDFLNYIIYYIENEEFIDFDLFQVNNRESYSADGYIRAYLALKRRADQGQLSGQIDSWLRDFKELSAFGLYHPYQDAELLRVLSFALEEKELPERAEDFLQICRETADRLLDEYREDIYIRLYCGLARWNTECKEEAFALWSSILDEIPAHYMAKYYSIRCYLEKSDWLNAKELLMDLLDLNGNDPLLLEQMRQTNDALILQYEDARKKPDRTEEEQKEDTLELCWCLFQNEDTQKALELLENFLPTEALRYSYENLYGRILYRDGQYEKALPHLKNWLELIEHTEDDGTAEMKKRITRRFRAFHILSGCCHELHMQEEALRYVDLARSAAEDMADRLAAMQYKAYLLLKYEKSEQCIDICDQLLVLDEGYYPAYVTRQEAAYQLKKGQQVVDDYYRAISIFPGHYKPYLLAAEVFYYYQQFEDAKGVLDRAVENQVAFTPKMKLFQIKILRNLATKEDEREELLKEALKLCRQVKDYEKEEHKEQSHDEETPVMDLSDLSQAFYEATLLCWDLDRPKDAISTLKQALARSPHNCQYHLVMGHLYLECKKYKDALNSYALAEDEYGEAPELFYNRGICHQNLGASQLARECFEHTLTLQEGFRDTCQRLADYYKDRYTTYCDPADFDTALDYMNRQLEAAENCYYLVERGRLFMAAFRLDEAIADYEKALTYVPDDWAAYNNIGCCYKYKGEFKKAIEYFEKAVDCLGDEKNILPYSNMADCYEALGHYEEAIRCYQKDLNWFPDRKFLFEEMGKLHAYLGHYDKAEECLNQYADSDDYPDNMASLLLHSGQEKKAIQFLEKRSRKRASSEEKAQAFYSLGNFYVTELHDFKKAVPCYQKGLTLAQETDTLFDLERNFAMTLFYLGQREQAKEHAQKAMEHFSRRSYSSVEDYLSYREYRPARLLRFGLLWICLGETEKGLEALRQITGCLRCRQCRFQTCSEKFQALGWYYEAIGEKEKALDYYEQALQSGIHCQGVRKAMEALKRPRKKSFWRKDFDLL